MGKSIKIIISILVSVFLFYLFIRDVNLIKIERNSGKGHGQSQQQDKIIYIKNIEGFQVGDQIKISDQTETSEVFRKITGIHEPSHSDDQEMDLYSYLIVDEALPKELKPSENAVIKFPRLQRALKQANYWWIVPSLGCTLIALMIRAYRWKLFFPNHQAIKFKSLWISVCIGYMANNVLPFRMGEIIRAWILGKKENRTISESFGTIVMERVFDILSILILFIAFIFYFSLKSNQTNVVLPDWLVDGAWLLAGISIIALFFLFCLNCWTDPSLRFLRTLMTPFPKRFTEPIIHLIHSFIQGLSIFSSFYSMLAAYLLSMVIWIDLAYAYYFMFQAVNIQATVLISMFLIVGLAFAVSIPSAPGFIGTFHFVGKQILIIMGLKGSIEAYVLLAHAMAYIPVVLLGLFYLALENISFKELKNSIPSFGKSE